MGRTDFSNQFRKIIIRNKRTGYDLNVMRHSACLVVNAIPVDNFAAPGGLGVRHYDGPNQKAINFSWSGSELSSVALSTGAKLMIFFCFSFQWCSSADQGSPSITQHIVSVESSSLLLHSIKT